MGRCVTDEAGLDCRELGHKHKDWCAHCLVMVLGKELREKTITCGHGDTGPGFAIDYYHPDGLRAAEGAKEYYKRNK